MFLHLKTYIWWVVSRQNSAEMTLIFYPFSYICSAFVCFGRCNLKAPSRYRGIWADYVPWKNCDHYNIICKCEFEKEIYMKPAKIGIFPPFCTTKFHDFSMSWCDSPICSIPCVCIVLCVELCVINSHFHNYSHESIWEFDNLWCYMRI